MWEFAEDLECDLPKFWDYIAEIIVHPVSSGRLPLAELKKAHEGVLQSGKIGKLVAKTLNKCTTLEVCGLICCMSLTAYCVHTYMYRFEECSFVYSLHTVSVRIFYFPQSLSQDRVSRIWSESGLDWTTHLRVEPDDVKYLIEDHVSGLH